MTNTLLIKTGDNDFYNTFKPMMEFLLQDKKILKIKDKTKLSFILSNMAFAFYVGNQNPCEYNGLEKLDSKYIQYMKNYLTVYEDQIFIDDEAVDYMNKCEYWDNGESYAINDYSAEVMVL